MNSFNVFDILNLDYLGLEKVKEYHKLKAYDKALEELRLYYFNRVNVEGFIKDKETTINYINSNFLEERQEILDLAKAISNKEYLFQQKWEMERTYNTVAFRGEIDWDLNPFGDEEWTYMLNRHRFFIALAESYELTGDKCYGEAFESQISQWLLKNRNLEEKKATSCRTIESGIRLKNWVKSLELFLKTPFITGELLGEILLSIEDHFKYLFNNHSRKRILSNWVILEQQGVYLASIFFPELKIAKEAREKSMTILRETLRVQVMEDGLHWEQSFQYHNEMLNCYLDIILLSERNNIEIDEDIKKKVKAMAYATFYIIKPNNCQSNYGDSDEEDLRDVIILSSLILKDGYLKNKAFKEVDIHTLLNYGIRAIKDFEAIKVKEVKQLSKEFKDVGLYTMRSGFNEDDSYAFFKCGFLGSGHGHSDMLHMEVSARGEDILVDSGRYNYSPKEPLRIALKKASSHNTSTVDDKEFTVCKSSWGNTSVATPINRYSKFTDKYDFVEGGHLGYMKEDSPVLVNRKLIFIKPYFFIVSDEFFTTEEHLYKQYFNFNKKGVEKIDAETLLYKGAKGDFVIKSLNENVSLSVEETTMSKDYNSKYKSEKAVYSLKAKGNTYLNTVLLSMKDYNTSNIQVKYVDVYTWQDKLVDKEYAEAIEMKVNNESFTVLIVHKDEDKGRKLYFVNDVPVYGRIAVIDKNGEVEVLAY